MVTIQRVQHVSIPMRPDGQAEARRFYGSHLGLTEIPPPVDLSHLAIVWFQAGADGDEIHCFVDERADLRLPAQHLCLQVDDLAALRANLQAAGVATQETDPIRNRPRCFVRDPFGNLIELTEITGPYDVAAPVDASASAG